MTIRERIEASEQQFETLKTEREDLLKRVDGITTELTKLQGEWRVLQDLRFAEQEELDNKKPNKKATMIDVPEEVS